MNVEEIDKRLRKTIDVADDDLFSTIVAMKKEAIESEDETSANLLWCYETIFNIQKSYLIVYKHLKKAKVANDELDENGYDSEKSREYETAWNDLERCEIQIGVLEENFCIPEASLQDYGINIVLEDTKRLQGLFPYKVFTSREMIIKSQVCTICGKPVSIRHPCGHIPGKVYMGRMCLRSITDAEFVNENIVTKPFDKYAILKVQGQKFDFSLLDYIVPHIAPYSDWSYSVEKRLRPEYKGIERNAKCPCGSGKKYKYCIRDIPKNHYEDHYKFRVER